MHADRATDEPLTGTHFLGWAYCDLAVGAGKETVAEATIDVSAAFGITALHRHELAEPPLSCPLDCFAPLRVLVDVGAIHPSRTEYYRVGSAPIL